MKYSKQKARGRPKKEQSEDIPSFELVAWDLLSLKVLTEKFAEPKKKRGQPKIIRKPCKVKLYESLEPLLDDLNKREAILTKAVTKAKIKVMLEYEKSDDPPTEQNSGRFYDFQLIS